MGRPLYSEQSQISAMSSKKIFNTIIINQTPVDITTGTLLALDVLAPQGEIRTVNQIFVEVLSLISNNPTSGSFDISMYPNNNNTGFTLSGRTTDGSIVYKNYTTGNLISCGNDNLVKILSSGAVKYDEENGLKIYLNNLFDVDYSGKVRIILVGSSEKVT